MQTLYTISDANTMVKEMCKRVDLAQRAGGYILAMWRLHKELPGGLIDMVEVAQVIKYVSEQDPSELKPQYRKADWVAVDDTTPKATTRTWYKPAN
jgi:hypothetical protein